MHGDDPTECPECGGSGTIPPEVDLLAELNALLRRISACLAHPRTEQDGYDGVWTGLNDAERAIRDALNDWPA